MKILCTGMSKTGTKTMAAALTMLGYTVYDFEEQYFYHGDLLVKMMEKGWTDDDIKEVYGSPDAVTDLPGNYLWEDIFRVFPDVKIIHMERISEDIWADSAEQQLKSINDKKLTRFLIELSPSGRKLDYFLNAAIRMVMSRETRTIFKSPVLNKSLAKIRYRQHNTRVKTVIPKDQLLEFKFSDGWGPLCKFLGKPVPDKSFPHKNRGASITDEFIDQSYVFQPIKDEIRNRLGLIVLLISVLVFYLFFYN